MQTETKIDNLISQIETDNVDLCNYYNKTEIDSLFEDKADLTGLNDCVILGISQTITANKTFNNACRFVSTIDEIPTVTGSSFIKSGADNTVVLLGAGGTKPISEFGGIVDDTIYLMKIGQATQSIEGNLIRNNNEISFENLQPFQYITKFDAIYGFVQKEGEQLQIIEGIIIKRKGEEASNYGDYLAKGGLNDTFVNKSNVQTITGSKTLTSNVNPARFVKTGKDDTSDLLAGGGDALLSSFGGVQVQDIIDLIVNLNSSIIFNYLKLARIGNYQNLMMEIQPKTQINTTTATVICSI
ncbi:MAG: hypothetical protein EZS28_019495 [Streblomastix strix]|uniref:Uncharacterized protein n=1 Tax=Streblomastix strix TaxID=222440 RepID=A0A5J4VR36_9EUKA|nr:MAG: hypothetical protein EZS28_019495 [Streblomastix strix]